MQAGETLHKIIRVVDGAGTGITGLTVGSFTVVAYGRAYGASVWSTYTHATAVVELSGGRYAVAFALPAAAGFFYYSIIPTSSSYTALPNAWEGEIENQDWDSCYAACVRAVSQLSNSFQLGMEQSLQLVAYRQRELTVTCVDQAGAPIATLGTDYPSATLRMSVRSQDQTTTKWDAGPTGTPTGFSIATSGSTLSITIPEAATFFSALGAGVNSMTLYYEVTGDYGSDSAKTRPLIRSSALTLIRREVGT
jgi:hypothetical protein